MAADVEKLSKDASQKEVLQDLEAVVEKQAERLICLDFHREVYGDLSEEEARKRYLADFILPEGIAQPETYKGKFDIALVVEPRISFIKQFELARRIKDLKLTNIVADWGTSQVVVHGIPQGGIKNLTEFPTNMPYLVWTHNAQKYRSLAIKQAVGVFGNDEVGSPQVEVTALYLQYPEYFINLGIKAAGSFYESGGVHGTPFIIGIVYDIRQPGFHIDWPDNPGKVWGALSRGKELIRLGKVLD